MVIAIIPARYGSTRFPGKPLALLKGKPLVRHVYERVSASGLMDRVIVATDDERIAQEIRNIDAQVIMTSDSHQSGTERCAEALRHLEGKPDLVINVQCDEPFIDAEHLALLVRLAERSDVSIATLIKRITRLEELTSPHVVKVVRGARDQALYFSRAVIPFHRDLSIDYWTTTGIYFKHLGMYAFRPEVLAQLVALPPHELEKSEALEQLRWLAHGYTIHTAETSIDSLSIDTVEDLTVAEKFGAVSEPASRRL